MAAKIHLYSKSSVETDWKCPRKYYWGYIYGGRGIQAATTHLELYLGQALHDSLAAIATQHLAGAVNIDLIAETAYKQVYEALSPMTAGEVDDIDFAQEQATLIDGLVRGFYKHVWPRLLGEHPKIELIEKEMIFKHDGMGFMVKPDLVVRDRDGGLWYIEYKSTSSKKEGWINSWNTAVQLHSSIRAIEQSLGEKVSGVIVQGLYKGYCLAPTTPVLTTDLVWKPVGDLKKGDKIAAFEEAAGNTRSGGKSLRNWQEATVIRSERTLLPCYELTMQDGTSFICSENHKWLTAYKTQGTGSARWTSTIDLVAGRSRIIKLIELWHGTGEIESYDAGYLAAAFDGEGCLSTMQFDQMGKEYYSLNLQFTQNPNEMLAHIQTLLTKYGITWSESDRGSSRKIRDIQLYGKIRVLSLLGKIRPKRLLPKLDWNKLGMIKDLPCRPQLVVSKRFVGLHEVVALETNTGTLIANGYASHNSSYGKQSSPFCYCYRRNGNPPFTQTEIRYDYAAGFKRVPTWELEGGVKKWVEGMPDNILSEQFPQTPPIFVNEDLINDFFRQRLFRESEILDFKKHIDDEGEDRIGRTNATFPQRFDQCYPGWGKPCSFTQLCHGPAADPLEHGYEWRDTEHLEPFLKLLETDVT